MVTVELVYVAPDKTVVQLRLELPQGSLVSDALQASGIHSSHPETLGLAVGIFSKPVSLDRVLEDRDRIEVYRPLVLDPKEKRRGLARKKKDR